MRGQQVETVPSGRTLEAFGSSRMQEFLVVLMWAVRQKEGQGSL